MLNNNGIHLMYRVEFMEYTNALKDTVYNPITRSYLHVGNNLLILENEIGKYMQYGKGYRKLEYVGVWFDRRGENEEKIQ